MLARAAAALLTIVISTTVAAAYKDDTGAIAENPPTIAPPVDPAVTRQIANTIAGIIRECWLAPVTKDAEKLPVKLRVFLNRDGSLIEEPTVIGTPSNPNPAFEAVVASATEAIRRCSPLKLPAEHYDLWKDLILNFDPRMLPETNGESTP